MEQSGAEQEVLWGCILFREVGQGLWEEVVWAEIERREEASLAALLGEEKSKQKSPCAQRPGRSTFQLCSQQPPER